MAKQSDRDNCKTVWWTNLLYINNIVDADKMVSCAWSIIIIIIIMNKFYIALFPVKKKSSTLLIAI